jgi:hypothetical protein
MNYSLPYCTPEECVAHPAGESCIACCPCDICGEQRHSEEAHERLERARQRFEMVCESY